MSRHVHAPAAGYTVVEERTAPCHQAVCIWCMRHMLPAERLLGQYQCRIVCTEVQCGAVSRTVLQIHPEPHNTAAAAMHAAIGVFSTRANQQLNDDT